MSDMLLSDVMNGWRPGSPRVDVVPTTNGERAEQWETEFRELSQRIRFWQVLESVRSEGMRRPVLLGNDGRVWDGHHRILAAAVLGRVSIPVDLVADIERGLAERQGGER